MKLKIAGILALATLCSAALLQPVAAQDNDTGFKRNDRSAAARHSPQKNRGGPQQQRGEHSPKTLDADGDGQISLEEFIEARLARLDEHFSRMDADEDGLISLEERTPPARQERHDRPNHPDRPQIDRDAVLACVRETIADYEPRLDEDMEDRFDNADTNADGFLSLAEVSAAISQRAEAMFASIDADGDGFLTKQELADHHANQLNIRRVVRDCIREQLTQA